MHVDVHQHIWTEPLLEALAVRRSLPFIRRSDGLTVLHCAGEPACVIDVDGEAPARRASLLRSDGLDLALIALSSPIGIEALAREAAQELIEAHLEGIADRGDAFSAWGPVALDHADPADVDDLVDRGCVGISLPAGALAGLEALDAVGPVLERIAARGAPLFVHPGRAPRQSVREVSLTEPLWFSALTEYVAQMQAAWLTFAALGRREHPELVVLFAMLAGGAPLLSERLAARGGPPVDVADPRIFYDTSSYGQTAVESTARRVGLGQLLYGSDRPVVEPSRTGREALLQANGARFLEAVSSAPIGAAL